MKKISLKGAVCLIAGSFLLNSCMVGSFGLFNKYREWQTNMTSNKFVNAVVGFVLGSFCYPITLFVDSIVLNSIEFWTGDNPVAENEGKTQMMKGKDGLMYAVTTLKNGYEIKNPAGEITLLTYNKKNNSWEMTQNGQIVELFRYNQDGTVTATMNGASHVFTLNEQGVNEARICATQANFMAVR